MAHGGPFPEAGALGAWIVWALCRRGHSDDVISFSCSLCGQLLPGQKPVCSRPPCVRLGSGLAGDTYLELRCVFAWEGARPAAQPWTCHPRTSSSPRCHPGLALPQGSLPTPAGSPVTAGSEPCLGTDNGQAQLTWAGLGLPEICSCHFRGSSWTGEKWAVDIHPAP